MERNLQQPVLFKNYVGPLLNLSIYNSVSQPFLFYAPPYQCSKTSRPPKARPAGWETLFYNLKIT